MSFRFVFEYRSIVNYIKESKIKPKGIPTISIIAKQESKKETVLLRSPSNG